MERVMRWEKAGGMGEGVRGALTSPGGADTVLNIVRIPNE